ncbi:MAG: iron uptake system protein EfeO [Pseudodonghicola sp.]
MPEPVKTSSPSRLFRVLVPVGAVLAIAGLGAFWWATQQRAASPQSGELIPVGVTTEACDPMELTVPAGRRSFEITNSSDRPIEWEILDGVMVLAERENIIPGYKQTLSTNLAPGDYEMTCGLLTNPRGVLHVTVSEEWAADAAKVELRDFLGALGEYKVYLITQGMAAVSAAETLRDAIAAGDLAAAQQAWIAARAPYKRIEPLAYRLSDLENVLDPSAEFLEKREEDPAFTGYHRLEYGLFGQKSLDGLGPVADQLVTDLGTLKTRLSAFEIAPSLLISLPADMAQQLADGKIDQGEDPYAQTDLDDFSANLEGIAKLAGLLEPIVAPVDPALKDEVAAQLTNTRAALEALKGADGYPPYDTVDEAAREGLSESFNDLAAVLGRLHAAIGGI